MRIAGQIGEHRGRPGKRAFGVNNPFAFAQRRQPLRERPCVTQCSVLPEELQPAAAMRNGQFFEEATAEQAPEHAHRQEEAWLARDPARAVGGEAAAGNDAMPMGMVGQRRAP